MDGADMREASITGFSHICIPVDDVSEAFAYYERILGAAAREHLSHWRNEGFFRGMGFAEQAAESEVSVGVMDLPGAPLVIVLMRFHYPEGRKTPVFFRPNDMSGIRYAALEVENIEEAFAYIRQQPDIMMVDPTRDYRVSRIDTTRPADLICFDWKTEGNFDRKQEAADRISGKRFFHFIDRYGVQWAFLERDEELL